MNAYETLLSRIPAGATAGKRKVIQTVAAKSGEFTDAIRLISGRKDLSAVGRAAAIEKQVQVTGATFRRAQRQHDYHADKIAKGKEAIKKKAIGEAQPNDSEYRTYLRSLDPGKRLQTVLADKEARGAALRAPGLSGLDEDSITRALESAVRENAGAELKAMQVAEEAQGVLTATLQMFQSDLLKAPFILDGDRPRTPTSPHELESYLDKVLPAPHQNAHIGEEVEIDEIT